MSHGHPTLAELRATVQKQRHREIGNWMARRVARPTAVYGTWLAVRLGLSAHQVTLAALAASLGGAWRSAPAVALASCRACWFTWGSGSIMSTARWRGGEARPAWTGSISIT